MHSSLSLAVFALAAVGQATAATHRIRSNPARLPRAITIDQSLVPPFGVEAGVNPTGTGDCEGINGIAIPCRCPPPFDQLVSAIELNLENGGVPVNNSNVPPISFPTGQDPQSVLTRLNAATVSLQNLLGSGVGCPAAATTYNAQAAAARAALEAGETSIDAPAPIVVDNGCAQGPIEEEEGELDEEELADGDVVDGIDVSLIPEFGFEAGKNPTGTGDCEGVNGVAIPCTCPPPRDFFIDQLVANVQNGRPVNNPDVGPISFPEGDDKESKLARLHTATVTLQNLFGPGVGCPSASTTFNAQGAALRALPDRF